MCHLTQISRWAILFCRELIMSERRGRVVVRYLLLGVICLGVAWAVAVGIDQYTTPLPVDCHGRPCHLIRLSFDR